MAPGNPSVPAVKGQWTYEPLKSRSVRWFWLKSPFSLQAVYGRDVPHRNLIVRFCDEDHRALESAFRVEQVKYEGAWWDEQAQFASTPGKDVLSNPDSQAASLGWQDYVLGTETDGGVGLLVRSGHHEVDLLKRRMKPCYWPASQHRILRATWFMEKGSDWVPLRETLADELEEAYRSGVWLRERGRLGTHYGLTAARIDLRTPVNEHKGNYAIFVGPQEIYLCKPSTTMSWLGKALGSSQDLGPALRRGYQAPPDEAKSSQIDTKAEAVDNAAARQPVTRLLLCVHGIGQNLSGANIASDAESIRLNLRDLAAEQLPLELQAAGRTEVLPVQWRKHLSFSLDTISEALMLPGVRSLRSVLHSTAIEVLLALTPRHLQSMMDSLIDFLNAQYAKFMARHPTFKGPVSIFSHSLGSVLMWDILCNQPQLFKQLHTRPTSASLSTGPEEVAWQPDWSQASSQRIPEQPSSGVSPDLMDLTGLISPSGTSPHTAGSSPRLGSTLSHSPEVQQLRRDNEQLRRELRQLHARLASGASAEPSGRSNRPSEAEEIGLASMQHHSHLAAVGIKALSFAVDQFFAVVPGGRTGRTGRLAKGLNAAGSPLGVFLALRGVDPARGQGLGSPAAVHLMQGRQAVQGDGLPACQRMYSLMHPFDPVVYRLEPLIEAGAEQRRPVYASLSGGGRRLHVGLTEVGEDMSATASKVWSAMPSMRFSSAASKAVKVAKAEGKAASTSEADGGEDEEQQEAAFSRAQSLQPEPDTVIWRLLQGKAPRGPAQSSRTAAGRLDFILQTGNVENPWLSALSSHFAYWQSPDTALFILRALHGLDVRQGTPVQPSPAGAA